MLDEFGFLAGAKGISEGVRNGKEAGKIIGSSIEDVQKEAVDVAQKRAQESQRLGPDTTSDACTHPQVGVGSQC